MNAPRFLTVVLACIGLAWGILNLSRARAVGDMQDIESDALLGMHHFNRQDLAQATDGQTAQSLSSCDTASQRALLLAEMPLADAALRSGAADQFDRRVRSIETRTTAVLGCAPRESFVWLAMFNLRVLHGQLDQGSFDLLANSYATSPNEAWISLRRASVAIPLVSLAGAPLRQKILNEFQSLVRNGFAEEAAHAYAQAAAPIRSLLQEQVDQLDPSQRKSFSDALQQLHS